MQRSTLAVVVVLALARACAADSCTEPTPCPANSPQLCKDCVAGVCALGPDDGFGNTPATLKPLCPMCTSDLCKQCLTYGVGAFGGPNIGLSDYPACTQKYLTQSAASLFGPNGLFTKRPSLVGASTKALCPYITTSDTLSCFDYNYGSTASFDGVTVYGLFESLCVAATSDLQRRCMRQYTSYTNFAGLPSLKNEVLKHTLPLCLSLSSEAQYACLQSKVQALDALVTGSSSALPAKTSYAVAKACGIATGITC